MMLFKRLFGRSKQPDQTMRGLGPSQTATEQEAIRNRMEAEVTDSKARRAAAAAKNEAKDSTT
jgi:hypothetical protein